MNMELFPREMARMTSAQLTPIGSTRHEIHKTRPAMTAVQTVNVRRMRKCEIMTIEWQPMPFTAQRSAANWWQKVELE